MSINITELEKGFAVEFPYELKDNFKSVFKTAKWNPEYGVWIVGPRSHKKLLAWVETAQVVVDAMEEKESQDEEARLLTAQAELQAIKAKIEASKKTQEETQTILDELANVQAEVEAAQLEQKQVEEKALQTQKQVETFLSKAIDLPKIKSTIEKMKKLHWTKGIRPDFDVERDKLKEEVEKLEKLGFYCPHLSYAACVNYNEPRRDTLNINFNFLDIRKID